MKRYHLWIFDNNRTGSYIAKREDPNGEWVKAADIVSLQEVARELEVLWREHVYIGSPRWKNVMARLAAELEKS